MAKNDQPSQSQQKLVRFSSSDGEESDNEIPQQETCPLKSVEIVSNLTRNEPVGVVQKPSILQKIISHSKSPDTVSILTPKSFSVEPVGVNAKSFQIKMFRLMKLSLSLIILILSLQIALSAVTLISGGVRDSSKSSYGPDRSNELEELEFDGTQYSHNVPKIGAYLKNYAGKAIQIIGEQNATEEGVNIWTLPELRVEDHIWEGKSITLDCKSGDYPVYWEYRGLGSPKVRAMTSRRAPLFYNTSSYSYEATVTFSSTSYSQTGEYSCRGVHNYGMGSVWPRAFLFVPGNKVFVATEDFNSNDGNNGTRSIRINADEDDSWVTLPCVPSSKEATVELYLISGGRQNSEVPLEMKKMSLSKSLTYDPIEGFRMKWKGMNALRNPWGNYVCMGNLQKSGISNEKLYLKVRGPNHSKRFTIYDESRGPYAGFEDEAPHMSMKFNPSSRNIECCTTPSSSPRGPKTLPPRMKLSTCISMSDCLLASTSTSSPICTQGNGNCRSDAFMTRLNDSCVAYEIPEDIHESGVLDCTSESTENQIQMQFSYDPQHGLVTQFSPESVETRQILSLTREKSTASDNPNEAVYFCNTNPFFFSDGLKWAIERTRRGRRQVQTMEFVKEESFPSRPTLIVDETQVAKVYCFAPIWDSKTVWRNISMIVPPRRT